MLLRLKTEGKTVVYHHHLSNDRARLYSPGSAKVIRDPSEIPENSYYLVDSLQPWSSPYPNTTHTIVVSSPHTSSLEKITRWVKEKMVPTFYMPLWKEDELMSVPGCDKAEVKERFAYFGGSARKCFDTRSFEEIKEEVSAAAGRLDASNFKHFLGGNADRGFSDHLLYMEVSQDYKCRLFILRT